MDHNNLPLVSIIITSYNTGSLIPKAIESALAQDYPNLEIIISDNASTDNSDEVIRGYTSDKRIKYTRNGENIGMLPNFRQATYELSKGDYITYVSSDDYLTDNAFISDSIRLVNKYENVLLVFGKLRGYNTQNGVTWDMPEKPYFENEIWNGRDLFFEIAENFLLSWGACLMNKQAMIKVRTLYVEYFNSDVDSNFRIMLMGNIGFINRTCYLQLGHAGNHGFPVDAEKIIQSMKCYENVAEYALQVMPGEAVRIEKWKNHFIAFTNKWAFYHLVKNETEYQKFKKGMKKAYPDEYTRFVKSRDYKRFVITQSIKKYMPRGLEKLIREIRK